MGRAGLIGQMERYRLVAVLRSKTSEDALATVRAVAEGGVRFAEITLTVPGAMSVIETLAKRNDLYVGAGTVLSTEQARQAISAGAQFVVSPTLELNLIPICHEAGVVCISGAATPTEIINAKRAGADLVKIFPADCAGGPNFVRQMLGPLPDVRFMVSGGVSQDNVKEYVALGVIGVVLGSASLDHQLSSGGHDGLVHYIRNFAKLVDEALGVSCR
ncbi:MAG: bifunctional 4-hydroxy-2-oxoglutarate aldolase/2-dehydro-3-deoxy-phosphogluconate aldolase [Candidatus Methylomirabilales bacterium]